jgi:hypothetical protein
VATPTVARAFLLVRRIIKKSRTCLRPSPVEPAGACKQLRRRLDHIGN